MGWGGGWLWPAARLDTTAFLGAPAFQDSTDTERASAGRNARKVCVCVCADHAELAPGGANGPELHHDVLVRFDFSGLGVLVRVVVQGLLLVVLVELLLCGARKDGKKGSCETEDQRAQKLLERLNSPSLSNVR